jgi:adenine-specific DNA-methyltransferase
MDPPYNQRQYCTNYHVLETIARYDRPKVYGVTGLRPHADQKSDFCRKHHALPTLDGMVRDTLARYVFLSYNSEGLMAKKDILDTLSKYGPVEVVSHDHTRFRADQDRDNRVYKADRVEEFLFCLEKD